MAGLHRQYWPPLWAVLLMLCHSYVHGQANGEAVSKCSAHCKCTTTGTANNAGQSADNAAAGAQLSYEVISNCWIPVNLPQLQCGPHWTALHLQILGDAQESDSGLADGSTGVSIGSDLFARCSSLNRLAIWKSRITSLPQTVFRPLVNLTHLILTVPTLLTLPDHFLAFLPSINLLLVKECFRLTQLTRSVFTPCPKSLRRVELTGNGLNGTLRAGLFRECDFQTLWLNENQLLQLEYGSLRGLSGLHHLRLDHNHLSGSLETALGYQPEIQSSAMSSTDQLRFLDLSYNRLTFIEGHLWSGVCAESSRQRNPVQKHRGLCFLEDLNLSNNQLHWLGTQAFSQLPRLRKLLLDGNQKLYNPDGLAGLAVSLYTLHEVQKIDTILLSLPSHLNNADEPRGNSSPPLVHQLKAFNVCEPNLSHLALFPQTLREIIEHLNRTACQGLSDQYALGLANWDQRNSRLSGANGSIRGDSLNSSMALAEQNQLSSYTGPIHCITMIAIALIVGSFFGCLLTGCVQLLANRHRKSPYRLSEGRESRAHLEDAKGQGCTLDPEVYDDLQISLPVRKAMSTSGKRSTPSPATAMHSFSHQPSMYYGQLVNQGNGQAAHIIPVYPNHNYTTTTTNNNNNCSLPMIVVGPPRRLPSEHVSLVNQTVLDQWQPQPTVFRPVYPHVPSRGSVGGSVYSLTENVLPTRRRAGSEASTTPKRCQRHQNRSDLRGTNNR